MFVHIILVQNYKHIHIYINIRVYIYTDLLIVMVSCIMWIVGWKKEKKYIPFGYVASKTLILLASSSSPQWCGSNANHPGSISNATEQSWELWQAERRCSHGAWSPVMRSTRHSLSWNLRCSGLEVSRNSTSPRLSVFDKVERLSAVSCSEASSCKRGNPRAIKHGLLV